MMIDAAEIRSRYYLRFTVEDRPGVLGRLTTVLGEHQVSIRQVIQDGAGPEQSGGVAGPVSVLVLTHEAREGDVRAALDKIAAQPGMLAPARLIRVVETP